MMHHQISYNVNSQIKFKTTMLKSSLFDYSDAYIHVKGKITITGAGDNEASRRADERNKGVAFKNSASFTICISEINNTQIDNCKDIDIIMLMYNLTENIVIIMQKHLEVCCNITEMNQIII